MLAIGSAARRFDVPSFAAFAQIEGLEERAVPTANLPDLHVLSSYLSGWTVGTTPAAAANSKYSTAMAAANGGAGAFELRGTPEYETGIDGVQRQLVNQRGLSDGRPSARSLRRLFRLSPRARAHPFRRHGLWRDPTHAGVTALAMSSRWAQRRAALIDITLGIIHRSRGSPSSQVYPTSDNQVQGISVGWTDVYSSGLAGQQINITGVANGDYWLEVVVDPLNHILETDETNNTSRP